MKINSFLALTLLLLLVSCALAVETTTQEANGARDKVKPASQGGGCQGGHCGGGSGGCQGGHCGGGGCQGGNCGGGGGGGGVKCGYHGCCRYYGNKCKYCCKSAEEAKAFAEQQAYP